MTLGILSVSESTFGVSMAVAPAYILSQKPGSSFGVAGYLFQGLLLIAVCVISRRFRPCGLFTVVTLLFCGAVLNLLSWPIVAGTVYRALSDNLFIRLWERLM